jgi:hypothetical protein
VFVIAVPARLVRSVMDDRAMTFGPRSAVTRVVTGHVTFGAGGRSLTRETRPRASERDQARKDRAEQRQEYDGLIHQLFS